MTASGHERWVHAKGERIYEDGKPKLSGVIHDITNQRLNEQRLMVLNRVLRHNLRNQLNAVMGYAGELRDHLSDGNEDLSRSIEQGAENLLALAEKSKQFEDASDYDYRSQAVALESLLDGLSSEYRDAHPDAEINVSSIPVAVPANNEAMRKLFGELLENALKHNDRVDKRVEVTMARPSSNRVAVSITDNGPGLPETEQAVLEAGEETALLHSDGLGLWTVNWLATKHSGALKVATNEDRGTTITVTLPTTDGNTGL